MHFSCSFSTNGRPDVTGITTVSVFHFIPLTTCLWTTASEYVSNNSASKPQVVIGVVHSAGYCQPSSRCVVAPRPTSKTIIVLVHRDQKDLNELNGKWWRRIWEVTWSEPSMK